MNTWLQKLACGFLTVLILGTALFSSRSVLAQGLDSPVNSDFETTNTGSGFSMSQTLLPICSVIPGHDGNIEGCAVRFIYYVILYPSAFIAGVAGQVFDYFINFSLSSVSYESGGFVEKGWKIVRDLANASFIFILLYLAITFVVNYQSQGSLKLLTRVILIAIVINFSLFTARVIIDAGNILARVFYEKIVIENDANASQTGFKTLSAGLLDIVNPQALLSSDMFQVSHYRQNDLETGTINNTLGDTSNIGGSSSAGATSTGFVIFIILIAAAINLMFAWIFFSVSIFFIGRTVGLWLSMIISPLAFASISLPVLSKIQRIGFNAWIKETATLSFMGVVFMFFLYLTIMFLEVAFNTVFNITTGTTIQKILTVVIPFAAVAFLLVTAKDTAKSMSGEFGELVGKGLKYAVMGTAGAAGLALGGAALVGGVAGRQIGGRIGKSLADKANTKTAWGRKQKQFGTYMSKASWDARNAKIPKPIGKVAGWGKSGLSYATGGAVGAGDFNMNTMGKGTEKGGYVQRREEYAKEKVERAKLFKADETTVVDGLQGTYTYEEIDPATGKVVKKTGEVKGKASVNGAKSEKANAQRILEAKKAEVHMAKDYDGKKRELERLEKKVEEQEKAYKELLDRKKAGDPAISQSIIDDTRDYLDIVKNGGVDPYTGETHVGIKRQKALIKDVENMYMKENNQVLKADAKILAAERALASENSQILNNYAKSVENWAAFPDLGLTHRKGANKSAAGEIRTLANKEEKKTEKK